MKKIDKSIPAKRITPTDGHYFFGYYDLQPFDASGRYHLTHKATFMDRLHERGDTCEIGMIDIDSGNYEYLETTRAWNFQQGAMLQWNPKAPDREIIYNDMVDYSHVGVVMDVFTGKKRFLERPVANVSPDGKYALSINMSRLYNFRPGYGYAEPSDPFYYHNHHKDDGVFLIDMETGKSKLILSLDELWDFSGSFFSGDEKMVINHINFNTDGSRFVMLLRNFPPKGGGSHKTALITASREGDDLYLLSDYGVQSHYFWINPEQMVIFAGGKELKCGCGWGNNFILTDKSHEGYLLADGCFWADNHMSFSPDRKLMLTDSYPDPKTRMSTVQIYNPEKNIDVELGRFYSVPVSTTDIRCDLHPRWNRSGDKVTFDSTHEGFRGVYSIDLPENIMKTLFDD